MAYMFGFACFTGPGMVKGNLMQWVVDWSWEDK